MKDKKTIKENQELKIINQEDVIHKPYQKPELIFLGDLRSFTLGPTGGIGESGNPSLFFGT